MLTQMQQDHVHGVLQLNSSIESHNTITNMVDLSTKTITRSLNDTASQIENIISKYRLATMTTLKKKITRTKPIIVPIPKKPSQTIIQKLLSKLSKLRIL